MNVEENETTGEGTEAIPLVGMRGRIIRTLRAYVHPKKANRGKESCRM